MARLARIVVPGLPHHVTQRGNRRERVFFEDGDHLRYLAFLAEGQRKSGTAIWAYCLMPNHVHVVAVPSHADGLRALFAEAHRRYAAFVNGRAGWTGHLWQGRYGSVVMDDDHLASAIRYVSLNPVRAGLVARAQDWPYSSVGAHLAGRNDAVVDVAPVLERFPDFRALIEAGGRAGEFDALRRGEGSGRPLGDDAFVARLGQRIGRRLDRGKPGRPRKPGDSLPISP
jgi:putative transposase